MFFPVSVCPYETATVSDHNDVYIYIEFEEDDTAEDSDINGDVNEFLLAKSSEAKMFAKATFFQKFQNEKSGLTQNRPLLLRLSLSNQQ